MTRSLYSKRTIVSGATAALLLSQAILRLAAADQEAQVMDLSREGAARWHFSEGAEFPGAAGRLVRESDGTVRLEYDFGGGGNYVAAYADLETPALLESVSFRLKKPAEARITVRAADATGQTFQKSVEYNHADWQLLTFSLAGWDHSWGGAEDDIFHQPARSIGFLVDNKNLRASAGAVLIADVTATRLPAGADAPTPRAFIADYRVTDFGAGAGFGVSGPARLENSVWTVDFSQGNRAALHHSLSLLGRPVELLLTVRGGAPGHRLTMHIGSHFQGFHRALGALEGGEQTFRVPAPPDGWEFGGGANDGKARPPLRLAALVIERGDGPAEAAALELVELRCRTNAYSDRAVTLIARLDETAATSETRALEARCTAWNLFEEPIAGALTLVLRDWEENELHRRTVEWVLPASARDERTLRLEAPLELPFADAEVSFTAVGQRPASVRAAFAGGLDAEGDATPWPESPWGMGVYLYRYPHTPAGHAQMDRAAAMARAAGVKWSREEFSWARIEPREGEYDFDYYDVVVDTAGRHGITLYGLLCYWAPWTEPYTPRGIEDFCRYARAVVRRYKDRIKHWEVYNEPNIFFWQGPKELYPDLLKACYAAIKEEDPEALVLGISTAGIDTAFIEQCLEAQAPFDILTIHPYRGRFVEETFVSELRHAADLVGGRPVWITEMGWSTQAGGVDERAQAQLLARCYLSAVASGACQNVSWYNFRCDGDDPFYNEHNFGVLRTDLTPKPGYRALATVCNLLSDGPPRPREDFGPDVYALEAGGAVALWTATATVAVECRMAAGETAAVFNLMGERVEPDRDGEILRLVLRPGCPVFVTGATLTPAGPPRVTRTTPERIEF